MDIRFSRYDDSSIFICINLCIMKTCCICKQSFSSENFYTTGRYLSYCCKSCDRERKAVYRAENKEKIAITDHKYINTEKGYVNETINGVFSRVNKNNNRKKWPPNCTKQEIYDQLMLYVQDHGRNCEYCKQPWTYLRGLKKTNAKITTNFSIDRLDSTKTYEISNLVFCCVGCNNRKNQVRLSDVTNIVRVWMKRICGEAE